MSPELNNSKTECDHYCHSCIHNITEEKMVFITISAG